MEEFDLFNKAVNEYNKLSKKDELCKEDCKEDCKHNNIRKEKTGNTCEDCGTIISKPILMTKEWRYYGAADTKHYTDPNRCHIRKDLDRNIFKDISKMGFSEKIQISANKIYKEITCGKIYRGNSRKSIIFACIFHAFKLNNSPQSHEILIKIFNLDKKTALKGLKFVNLNAPKSSPIRTVYITPENLICEIMNKFEATEEHKKDVIDIYKKIKNRSSILNRSRPQSIASGIVRYYILTKKKNISMEYFKQKVNLSELTINRIVKEIARILGNKELM